MVGWLVSSPPSKSWKKETPNLESIGTASGCHLPRKCDFGSSAQTSKTHQPEHTWTTNSSHHWLNMVEPPFWGTPTLGKPKVDDTIFRNLPHGGPSIPCINPLLSTWMLYLPNLYDWYIDASCGYNTASSNELVTEKLTHFFSAFSYLLSKFLVSSSTGHPSFLSRSGGCTLKKSPELSGEKSIPSSGKKRDRTCAGFTRITPASWVHNGRFSIPSFGSIPVVQ